jgi:hypothetical protein
MGDIYTKMVVNDRTASRAIQLGIIPIRFAAEPLMGSLRKRLILKMLF